MDRFDNGIRCSCQETIDQMRARNGFRLGAPISLEFSPDASERERRGILIQGEPQEVLFFGVGVRLGRLFREAVRRDQTAVLWLEPSPPVSSCQIECLAAPLFLRKSATSFRYPFEH